MWREYSKSYLKNNRSSSLSVRIAAFLSALLLSLLCGLFYNAWKYEIERIELEEGGWQSRIVIGSEDKIEDIKNFASVKDVIVNRPEDGRQEITVDLYFYDYGSVLEDTPEIAASAGSSPEMATYNYALLAMYLIRSPQDTAPRMVFPLFLLIMGMASFSLIVIIHNSFAVSMNARIHQFGIFSSIGATPRQIRTCLLQEAAALSAAPLLLGNVSGIGISMVFIQMSNSLLRNDTAGRHKAVFGYHPLVLAVTLLVTVITIWISAWIPAGKLSRLTPLEAIKNAGELQLKRKKRSRILSMLFGIEGELAGNALRAQKKALRTASLSLLFSFMAFVMMQCFFTLTQISTRETYFERYQYAWDIMVTVKDTQIDTFSQIESLQSLSGAQSVIVYQKADAARLITEDEMSEEMKSFGGFLGAPGQYVIQTPDGWLVNAPLVILDDASFLSYCGQIGAAARLDGAVVRNVIRDVTNPDFRHPVEVPYLKTDYDKKDASNVLAAAGRSGSEGRTETVQVPVLAYTAEVPVLREEYATIDYYELVHFLPVSFWRQIKEQIGGTQDDIRICVLGRENADLEELNALQGEIMRLLGDAAIAESENRIQEYEANADMIWGMKTIFGFFCILLALIGIGNVFSNTSGFVRQRKREFARYLSVGMTPQEIRRMFCIEAFALVVRPVLITLPAAAAAVWYMLRAGYVEASEFFAEAPFLPIALFMLSIAAAVSAAYYLGWRSVRKINPAEVLRDDTML